MPKSLDAYKELIDVIAGISNDDIQAIRIENDERWPDTASLASTNTFIEKLSSDERALLVRMLTHSRHGGIHDTLVRLNEMIDHNGLRLVRGGSELPVEPFGTKLSYDWECRRNGDEWPDPI